MEKLRTNKTRIRQRVSAACDACRERKVKCLLSEDESKCSMCSELDIECKNELPRKKRGPKNRYVQALRAQLDGGDVEDTREAEGYRLNLIAPVDVLERIIDDWFDWIHPVAPIFHRQLLMEELKNGHGGQGNHETSFLFLVASICAATYASLRRRQQNYGSVTVDSCLELVERFNFWSASHPITLQRALTFYNFSSASHHEYGIDSSLTFRIGGEAAICIKYLVQQEMDQMSFLDQQILKRLYWLTFAGQCTSDMHGRRGLLLHHAHETTSTLIPIAMTDEQLLDGSVSVPMNEMSQEYSYVPGLNALSRLFLVWQSSQAISVQTMENIHGHILASHRALDGLPPELVWQDGANQSGHFGFNVQKVNLKVTQLHIRSNLLEQMNALAKTEGFLVTPDTIIDERHLVVDELLHVLYTMPEEVFDANGYSIVPKIRDIGSALLDELRTGEHGRTLQASISLDKLLAKLENLDLRPMAESPYFR